MPTATLTSKGQITVPIEVRKDLGVETGDRIEFVKVSQGQFAIMAATNSVRQLRGLVSKPAKPVSIEEMNAAIVQKAAGSQKTGVR